MRPSELSTRSDCGRSAAWRFNSPMIASLSFSSSIRILRELAARLVARRIAALVLSTDPHGAFLIAWLFLTKLVANDALILGMPRLRHAGLAAMLATLVALALEIVFLRHLFSSCSSYRQPLSAELCSAAILHLREPRKLDQVGTFRRGVRLTDSNTSEMPGGPDVSNGRRFSRSTSAPMGCPAYFWLSGRRHQRRLWRDEPRGRQTSIRSGAA